MSLEEMSVKAPKLSGTQTLPYCSELPSFDLRSLLILFGALSLLIILLGGFGYTVIPPDTVGPYAALATLTFCFLPALYFVFWSQPTAGRLFELCGDEIIFYISIRTTAVRRRRTNSGFTLIALRQHTFVVHQKRHWRRVIFPRYFRQGTSRYELTVSEDKLRLLPAD